jgi:hypothetical protein
MPCSLGKEKKKQGTNRIRSEERLYEMGIGGIMHKELKQVCASNYFYGG